MRHVEIEALGVLQISVPDLSGLRLACAFGFVFLYLGGVTHYSFAQERTDRAHERIDELVRDLSETDQALGEHRSLQGHPEMVARVERIEAVQGELRDQFATIKGGGIALTALLALLQLLSLMNVRLSIRPKGGAGT